MSPSGRPPAEPLDAGIRRRDMVLEWAGYAVTALVAAGQLRHLAFGSRFLWMGGLLATFAITLVLVLRFGRRIGKHASLAVMLGQSGLVVGIMVLSTRPAAAAILFFIVGSLVATRFSVGVAVAWAVGACLAIFATSLKLNDHGLPALLTFAVAFFAIIAFAVAFRRSLEATSESQELLRDLAVNEERARLAREMHDAVGHRLTVAAVLLEAAARLIPSEPDRASGMVESSRSEVRRGLEELRAAVSALKVDAGHGEPLIEALSAIVQVYGQAAGIRVVLEVDPEIPEPDAERKLAIIRTVQEALTNVQKHAGASEVTLALDVSGDAYRLTCRDNGRGITGSDATGRASRRRGFGIENLRARATAVGGSVDLDEAPGGGTILRLILPIKGGE